jgi:hypothetical protein
MEPHRVEWRRDGETHLIAVERVAHNGPIDASMFDAPAPALQPPLDVETVLSAARRGEAQAEALRAPYAYTRTSRSRTLDGGDVRQDDSYSYEIFHLGDGAPVFRMIDRNGQGLSERQRRSEDERVAEMVARYERDRLSGQRRDRGRTQSRSSGSIVFLEPLARRDWLDAYVRMADFGSLRRERVLSRAALVLEFEPKGRARPSGDFERQTHSMAGAIWIDEATHQVMRIESWLRDGVGAFVPGSSFRAERVFVGDEVWLPSIDQTNLRHTRGFGRPFLFFGANEYFDHKKFGVTFDSTIAPPDVEP